MASPTLIIDIYQLLFLNFLQWQITLLYQPWCLGLQIYIVPSTLINCSSLITMMANANVPPQGGQLPGSIMIKCNWDYSLYHERYFTIPPAFEVQMGKTYNPNDTLPSHLHKSHSRTTPRSNDTWSMMQHALTRSVGVICLSRYLQHLTLTGYKIIKPYSLL